MGIILIAEGHNMFYRTPLDGQILLLGGVCSIWELARANMLALHILQKLLIQPKDSFCMCHYPACSMEGAI
jgi:hypothetical protein